jgi:hypothetical protein
MRKISSSVYGRGCHDHPKSLRGTNQIWKSFFIAHESDNNRFHRLLYQVLSRELVIEEGNNIQIVVMPAILSKSKPIPCRRKSCMRPITNFGLHARRPYLIYQRLDVSSTRAKPETPKLFQQRIIIGNPEYVSKGGFSSVHQTILAQMPKLYKRSVLQPQPPEGRLDRS